MTFKQFCPKYFLYTDDNELLYIMIAHSNKQGAKAVFSVLVDQDTNRFLGNVVESRIRAGFNEARALSGIRKDTICPGLNLFLKEWTKSKYRDIIGQ